MRKNLKGKRRVCPVCNKVHTFVSKEGLCEKHYYQKLRYGKFLDHSPRSIYDPNEYRNVLKNLMIQGFIKLMEENINIICKKEDYNIVCGLVEQAKTEFLEKLKKEAKKGTKLNMNVTVDSKYYLPETIIGGVFLTSMKSKIRVDNALDKRLDLLKQKATPQIRKILFEQKA